MTEPTAVAAAAAAAAAAANFAAGRERECRARAGKAAGAGARGMQPRPAEGDPSKLDIRVGMIVKAWEHPDSGKLYCDEVDLGEVRYNTLVKLSLGLTGLLKGIEKVPKKGWPYRYKT